MSRVLRGSGTLISEDRHMQTFHAISVRGVGQVHLVQGDLQKLTITTDENLMSSIQSSVSGGILYLSPQGEEPYTAIKPTSLVYEIVTSHLDSIRSSGAVAIESEAWTTKETRVIAFGSTNIALNNLVATELNIDLQGGGHLKVTGQVESCIFRIAGAGYLDAGDLQVNEAQFDVTGAGRATVRVHSQMSVAVNGAGIVEYFGDPIVSQRISGTGRIVRLAD